MRRFNPILIFRLFIRSSRVQKKRAILTVAAIAWGSLALLLLLSFGEGLKRQLSISASGMGSDLAVLWPGQTSLPWQGLPEGRQIRLTVDDVELLKERVPELAAAVGEMGDWRVVLSRGRTMVTSHVIGANWEYGEMRNHIPQPGGRFFNPRDEEQRRRVIFMGYDLAEKIFGSIDPVGETLLLAEVPYTVIGVMQPKLMMGNYSGMDKDHAVIPLSTFRAQMGREQLENLVIKPNDPSRMKEVLAEVRRVLASKHGFDPADERAFMVWDTVETTAITRNMLLGIQVFLGIIGALTLTVGGVGVANIMYAVVKERTREIGVKMALGARRSWITGPIVLEGLSYTLLGGALGLLMAMGAIMLLELVPTEGNEALRMLGKPTLSPAIGIGSATILGMIGLVAGYFPARRAASVDPAETLRYE